MLRVPVRHGLLVLLVSGAALAQPTASAPAGSSAAPPPAPPQTQPPVQTQAQPPAQPQASPAPTGGTAPPLQACATRAFDTYAVDMSVWERQWAEGVVSVRPDFTPAAIARANAHNSALQRDGFRIHYLAANAPDSLDLDESIAAMRLFDWTQEQEQALRLSEPDYASVADAADRDRLAADAQPKADELENYFEETFTESAGAVAARKLGDILRRGNDALEQCHRLHPPPPPKPDSPDAPPPGALPDNKAPAGGGIGKF